MQTPLERSYNGKYSTTKLAHIPAHININLAELLHNVCRSIINHSNHST